MVARVRPVTTLLQFVWAGYKKILQAGYTHLKSVKQLFVC